VWALCFVAFAAFSGQVKHEVLQSGESAHNDSLPVGKAVPDFTLPDRAGASVTLGKVTPAKTLVMIQFWGAWCGGCRLEMPSLEKLYRDTTNKGLEILAVDVGDSTRALDAYLRRKPVSFPVLRDSEGAVTKRFGVRAFPTTVLVGSDGRVARVIEGVEPYMTNEVAMMLRARTRKP
jgi:peroxiredoxin